MMPREAGAASSFLPVKSSTNRRKIFPPPGFRFLDAGFLGTRASRPLCHMAGLQPGPPVRACGRDARVRQGHAVPKFAPALGSGYAGLGLSRAPALLRAATVEEEFKCPCPP